MPRKHMALWLPPSRCPFVLDEGERAALPAFLRSLTDESFLRDPRFADPWPR
jgi:hypothetical protein